MDYKSTPEVAILISYFLFLIIQTFQTYFYSFSLKMNSALIILAIAIAVKADIYSSVVEQEWKEFKVSDYYKYAILVQMQVYMKRGAKA